MSSSSAAAAAAAAAAAVEEKKQQALSPRLSALSGRVSPPPVLSSAAIAAATKPATPSRSESNTSKRYANMDAYVAAMGGKRSVTNILIANNGIAAVKAIRSIRKWCYEVFGDSKVIKFIAMATPEDLKANAEYIHMADKFIKVPGGSNNHNYANIKLISDIAERYGADAVWAGWGHASENPKLPEYLSEKSNKVVWIGPPPSAMRALGDKIGSTLIAQSANVSCIPWSGDGLTVNYAKTGIPDDVYQKACVHSAEEAERVAEKIGFPVMIKASEGGGGKGIRMIRKREEIAIAFPQVQGEVPGSPIFVMRLAPDTRHLEVQLLADEWGDAIAIFGRDCSIQRRHQKIIEEGPVVAAPPLVWKEMEQAAVRLAREVGYVGAGTVEYLFTSDHDYYFLELNPRLQVEHPVTELVSGVNLPAAQVQVAMGIPLHRLRGVRRMYNRDLDGDDVIDFGKEEATVLPGHVIACRITAENPDQAFQPTSGGIQELNFRSTPDVWGYFSVGAAGGVHEFSDSQFGHLFSVGETRELARRNMVIALKELSIRGDISTTIEYLPKVLEMEDFVNNNVNTTWLEKVMGENAVHAEKPPTHRAVVLGAVFQGYQVAAQAEKEFLDTLNRGQLPSRHAHRHLVDVNVSLIYENVKYHFDVARSGPNSFDLQLRGDPRVISVDVHALADGGFLVLVDGVKHVLYGQVLGGALRLVVDGQTCNFTEEYDPSRMRATIAGKLVRFLVADGAHVEKNEPYAEMEVMKMYVTLKAPEAGVVSLKRPEGTVLDAGDLIAELSLDDESRVRRAETFAGEFPAYALPQEIGNHTSVVLRYNLRKLSMLLDGYKLGAGKAEEALTKVMGSLRDPTLPLLQFEEVFSTLAGRIPESLYTEFQTIAGDYSKALSSNHFYWESPEPFPIISIQSAIDAEAARLAKISGDKARDTMLLNLRPIADLLQSFRGGNHMYAVTLIRELLEQYLSVEEHYNQGVRPEAVARELRQLRKASIDEVAIVARAHSQLQARNMLVCNILDLMDSRLKPVLDSFSSTLLKLTALTMKEVSPVAIRARRLLVRLQIPSYQAREVAVQTILDTIARASSEEERVARIAPLIDHTQPIGDVIFSFFNSTNKLHQHAAIEVCVRRAFSKFSVPSVRIQSCAGSLLKGVWDFQMLDVMSSPSSTKKGGIRANDSFSALQGVRSSSIPEEASSADEESLSKNSSVAPSPTTSTRDLVQRHGTLIFAPTFELLKDHFDAVMSTEGTAPISTSNILYLAVGWKNKSIRDTQLALYFKSFIQTKLQAMDHHVINRVTFIAIPTNDMKDYPAFFTYRRQLNFDEDMIVRNLEPSYAVHLNLDRLCNFHLTYVPTTNRRVHIFAADPKAKEARPSRDWDGRRLYARCIIRTAERVDMSLLETKEASGLSLDAHPEAEYAFVECLNALEMAIGDEKKPVRNNHIFVNVLVEASLSPDYIRQVIRLIARRYSEKLRRLYVAAAEFSIVLKKAPDAPGVRYRYVCCNPTGAVLSVDMYYHAQQGAEAPVLMSTSRHEVLPLQGVPVDMPYAVTEPFETQRARATAVGTIWVFDFVTLFDKALRDLWLAHWIATGKSEEDSRALIPERCLDAIELVAVTEQDGTQHLSEIQRPIGQNKVGMVAWKMVMCTPEYENGREVVIIANDITHQAGTFAPQEDVLFDLASKYARARGLPRVYLAANSGARIGLAEEVMQRFRIAWTDNDPLKGFQYMYVTPEEAAELKDSIFTKPLQVGDEVRHVITDIVGAKDGLGVENLVGSGLIAGETSAAYDEIFTLSYVTGRTVGIGAYLVRLGQRTIQKKTPPILLTGFDALNKLLGREVYSSNIQLGGPDIMFTNGVTHQTVGTDMEGVFAILKWLSYVPKRRFAPVPVSPRLVDDPTRTVDFHPQKDAPYDPRFLIEGTTDAETGEWVSGFFDKGSFTEMMGGWARSVVSGRARLGGVPMGVIAVETRTIEENIPADPALPESNEQIVFRAGQVWYPDSAFKTAQAITDMRAEDLPIMVFANWRGFSGGMQDMLQEILKFGSYIVDAFRGHRQPVFVYLPPYSTLRGGAWVVVDSTINAQFMEMYADPTARAGVLETEGTVGVKFRLPSLLRTAHRLDDLLLELDGKIETAVSAEETTSLCTQVQIRERELQPMYHQAAMHFADLHDTPGRMIAKKAIREIISWKDSRAFFFWRLKRRLAVDALLQQWHHAATLADLSPKHNEFAKQIDMSDTEHATYEAKLQALVAQDRKQQGHDVWANDSKLVQWLESNVQLMRSQTQLIRKEAALQRQKDLLASSASGLAQFVAALDEAQLEELTKVLKLVKSVKK